MTLLFLCKGNRGRSQIAEALFNKLHPNNPAISAGIEGHHEGESLSSEVISVLSEEGIDVSNKRVKKLTEKMVDSSDKIIILCGKEDCNKVNALLKKNNKNEFWDVPDTEGKGANELRKTKQLLKKKIEEISIN